MHLRAPDPGRWRTRGGFSAVTQTPDYASFPTHKDRRALVAIDLGAESCRVSLLHWRKGSPSIQLIARIPNAPYTDAAGNLRWPFRKLETQLHSALQSAVAAAPEGIRSIGVDGWAVDYVRLNAAGQPSADPFCYRDERTVAAKNSLDTKLTPVEIFKRTGVQPMRINTLYQLVADHMADNQARRWLLLPEYLLHSLGAEPVAEFTNATHTGLVDTATRDWSPDLFARANLSIVSAPQIVKPGTIVGRLRQDICHPPVRSETMLIAPACHDTASAIAAMQSEVNDSAYLICGTWSIVGARLLHPVMADEARQRGFTNLGAADGAFCFHTNINGMWMLKQCVEQWQAEGRAAERLEFGALAKAAEAVRLPAEAIFPVDAPELLLPSGMPQKILYLLRADTGIRLSESPDDEAVITRLILNSLAHRYARAIRELEELSGRRYARIEVLGGGARNALLLQLIARSTGCSVTAGAVEASTLGNFALQLTAGVSAADRAVALRQAVQLCGQAQWEAS